MKRCTTFIKPLLTLVSAEDYRKEIIAERCRGMAFGLMTGMTLGGLAGVFFAPDKGRKTRKKTKKKLLKAKNSMEEGIKESSIMLSEKASEQKEAVTGYISDAAGLVKEKAEGMKQSLGDLKGSAEEGVAKGKQSVEEAVEDVVDGVGNIVEKVEDQVEETVEKAVNVKTKVEKAGAAAKKELTK